MTRHKIFKLSDEQDEKLKEFSEKIGTPEASIMRIALSEYLEAKAK